MAAQLSLAPCPQGQWRQRPVSGNQIQPLPVSAASPACQQLFISYSHSDRPWVDRLQTMIAPLGRSEALLEAAEREGLRILWVCLSPCFFEAAPINDYQAVLPPGQLLVAMNRVEQKAALQAIAGAIEQQWFRDPEAPGDEASCS